MSIRDAAARAADVLHLRIGDKARRELPLCEELLDAEHESICRGICLLVDKGADVEKLRYAACELAAVRNLATKLRVAIGNAKIARERQPPQGG